MHLAAAPAPRERHSVRRAGYDRPMPTTRLSREELYNRVWSEPIQRLSKQFGLSDRGLTKLCSRHQIPVPYRGYWQRKAHGHSTTQLPLPAMPESPVIVVGHDDGERPSLPPPTQEKDLHPAIAFERRPENRIAVLDSFPRRHALLESTKREWKRRERQDWHSPSHPALDLRISKAAEDRAFRIMQTLLVALEQRGYKVEVEKGRTLVKVLGETVQMHMSERGQQVKKALTWEQRQRHAKVWWREPQGPPLDPTGDLRLRTDTFDGDRWADHKGIRLERHLNDFIEGLVEEALKQKRWRAEREEVERRHQEAMAKRWEDEKKVTQWEEWMSGWQKAKDIRAFAAALREACQPIEPGGETEGWLAWAEDYANRFDPLRETD
jgi:hypothetical protein